MQKPFVIITVPHAAGCGSPSSHKISHPCDRYGPILADTLANSLKEKNVEHRVFKSQVPRDKIRSDGRGNSDMNRKWNRDTEYRKMIAKEITDRISQGYRVWVIDCHSFPPGSEHYGPDDSDFVILDTRDGEYNLVTSYVYDFLQKIRNEDSTIRIKSLPATDPWEEETDDIMDTSRELGARSFLIEVREGTLHEKIKRFTQILTVFIVQSI